MPTEMDKITAGMVDSRFPKSWLYWFQRLVKLIGQKLDIVLDALGKLPVLNEKGELEASDLVAEQVVQGQGTSTTGHVAMFADTTATLIEDAGAALPEPSETVVSETSYGQDASAGSEDDTTYSKGSHTHGTPEVPDFDDLGDVDFTGEAWGDIVFRGEDKWNNLAPGSSGQVLKTAGADADPAWDTLAVDDLSDVEITDAEQGDLLYHDGEDWVNLHHGTNGQVLTTGGDGADPSWADPTDDVATAIHAADPKTTPTDADELGLVDSAASYALKSLTWANVEAALKTYFDTQYLANAVPYWPKGYWPEGYWPDGYWPSETLTLAEIVSSISLDGWHKDSDEWLYSTAYVFYIAGKDVTARFPRGTKIKLTQTTEKFWYVDYSTYTGGNTGVVLAINADYTLANAEITSPHYSYAANPQGFPACFNHVDSWDGFSTAPSGGCCTYSIEGGMVTLNIYRPTDGVADANNCSINLPLTARNVVNYYAASMGFANKAGSWAAATATVAQNASAAVLYPGVGTAATDWNTSGAKLFVGQIRYHL